MPCTGSWVFQEDESRVRTGHAAYDMSILRRETTAKGGIAAKHKQVGWNDGYLLKILSNWNAIALAFIHRPMATSQLSSTIFFVQSRTRLNREFPAGARLAAKGLAHR